MANRPHLHPGRGDCGRCRHRPAGGVVRAERSARHLGPDWDPAEHSSWSRARCFAVQAAAVCEPGGRPAAGAAGRGQEEGRAGCGGEGCCGRRLLPSRPPRSKPRRQAASDKQAAEQAGAEQVAQYEQWLGAANYAAALEAAQYQQWLGAATYAAAQSAQAQSYAAAPAQTYTEAPVQSQRAGADLHRGARADVQRAGADLHRSELLLLVLGAASGDAASWASSSAAMAVKRCESGNNYSTNTGNGYYGAWQFDAASWLANGGGAYAPTADQAPSWAQDQVAYNYYSSAGWGPWECAQ